MANPRIVVDFVANTTELAAGAAKAGAEAEGFGSKLKGLGKFAALAAGTAALGALAKAVDIGIDKFEETAKVTAQTQAVLTSTGDVAGVTAKEVEELAVALMHKSGVDDDTIHSGENLLLTFKNIRNETGKNNDIFTRATKTMVDMSVALGKDMGSSATILGKALNDPVKGLTSLQRIGVAFTPVQKEMIKNWVAHGETVKAQNLILDQLNQRFAGSAEALGKTLPGQINIAKESFKQWAGSLVADVIPVIEDMISWLRDHWPEIQKAINNAWNAIEPVIAALIADIAAIVKAVQNNWSLIGPILDTFVTTIKNVFGIASDILNLFAALLRGDWSQAWKDFEKLVGDVFKTLVDQIKGGVLVIETAITVAWKVIKALNEATWNAIKAVISAVWGAITGAVSAGINLVKRQLAAGWNVVKGTTLAAWHAIQSTIGGVLSAIGNALSGATIVRSITNMANAIKGVMSGLAGWLSRTAAGLIQGALHDISGVFWTIVNGAESAVNGVKNVFGSLVGWLGGLIKKVEHVASDVAHAIASPINSVLKAWNSLRIPGFHIHISLPGPIPDINFGWGGIGLPNIPLLPFAKGGVVDRPTIGLLGEAGREIVTPEALLRDILGEQAHEIHVYIGDRELTDLVRVEVNDANTGLARTLLAGAA